MSNPRRRFLRGRFRSGSGELRPPWALAAAFEDRCDRCGECIRACPERIVVIGSGGFPEVDFRNGECTFCGDCATSCKPAALLRSDDAAAWALKASIGETCLAADGIECRVCGEACGAGAIRFRPRIGGIALPQLDASGCTGCGACYAPCPANAIEMNNRPESTK